MDKIGLAAELESWWLAKAQAEVDAVVPKAVEYGGRGNAIDLEDIGADLARLMGADLDHVDWEATVEMGIYFYLRGKVARWTAALLEGRRVSDDTLHDISVYCRMAQRLREVHGWPFNPELNEGD